MVRAFVSNAWWRGFRVGVVRYGNKRRQFGLCSRKQPEDQAADTSRDLIIQLEISAHGTTSARLI